MRLSTCEIPITINGSTTTNDITLEGEDGRYWCNLQSQEALEAAKKIEELRKENYELRREMFIAQGKVERLEGTKESTIESTIACLRTVEAMMNYSQSNGCADGGFTHRERNFFCKAIIQYVTAVVSRLEGLIKPLPF